MTFEDIFFQNLVKKGKDINSWSLFKNGEYYYFEKMVADRGVELLTPNLKPVTTIYSEIANQIMDDFKWKGNDAFSVDSILYWHCTTIDLFAEQDHITSEKMLCDMFLNGRDWSFGISNSKNEFIFTFGTREGRTDEIKQWLSKCTIMQLSAAYCLALATGSLNLAYVVAMVVETYEREDWHDIFYNDIYELIKDKVYRKYFNVTTSMDNFALLYNIHVKENGPLIVKELKPFE